MDSSEQSIIHSQLSRMIPDFCDLDYDEQYRKCYEVYNTLDDVRLWELQQFLDPVNFKSVWFWRRKS